MDELHQLKQALESWDVPLNPTGFIIETFPCPNCNHQLLIDRMQIAKSNGDRPVYMVGEVLDYSNYTQTRHDYPADVAAMGDERLRQEVMHLRREVDHLQPRGSLEKFADQIKRLRRKSP